MKEYPNVKKQWKFGVASVNELYRLPIHLSKKLRPILAPFPRYGKLFVEKRNFFLPARVWRPIFDNSFTIAKRTHELTCVVDGMMVIRTPVCQSYRHASTVAYAPR